MAASGLSIFKLARSPAMIQEREPGVADVVALKERDTEMAFLSVPWRVMESGKRRGRGWGSG